MTTDLTTAASRAQLARLYRDTLLGDVMPFWLRHGMDSEHGGIMTCLDRDGSIIDTDKSVWFQGRTGWMFATLYNTVERRDEWLDAARSLLAARAFIHSPDEDACEWCAFAPVCGEAAPRRAAALIAAADADSALARYGALFEADEDGEGES